jgi:hypothetical protein
MVSNLYLNVDAKTATLRVMIGGVLMQALSAEWDFAYQRPATAMIRVRNPAPASAVFGAAVQVESGFNGLTVRDFTGTVLNVNPDETGCTIECQGMSAPLENTFHKVVVTIDGTKTATQLVTELLQAAGIAAYSVNLPAWRPGTVCQQTLEFSTYSEAIIKIAEVDGGQWYELPTGLVRVAVVEPWPSGTAWRTYFSGVLTGMVETRPAGVTTGRPRLRHIGQAQQTRDVKNQAWVRGCTYGQVNPDGTTTPIDVEGTAVAASPWVKNPDGSQAYNDYLFSNETIDLAVKAGTVAARLVTYFNRRLTQITAQIDGDPEIVLGATVDLEDPSYSRTTGNWFVGGYRTAISESAFTTDLTSLLGGDQSGSTPNICPFALFTYFTELEVMGSQVWAVVTLDGCASVDPDGTIVLYSWSDNQSPHRVSASGTDCTLTVKVDPWDTGGTWMSGTFMTGTAWEVTLTVTDDKGCADSITVEVPVEAGVSAGSVPALFVAFDAWFSASPDGGVNWNDQAAPSGWHVVAVTAKQADGVHDGYGVYGLSGTAGGRLYQTIDYCATAPVQVLAGLAAPVEHVWWDNNHPTDCWALTKNELWRSQSDGAAGSWSLYKNLNALPWLVPASGEYVRASRIATPAPEGVWVFGGQYIDRGAGIVAWPLVCWDALLNGAWAPAQVGGELSGDLGAGGPLDLYIREAASRQVGELAVLFNSATWASGVYYTADVFGDGSGWKRASGLPAKSGGMWLAPDWAVGKFAFAFNDAVIYLADLDPVTGRLLTTTAAAHLDTAPSGTDWPNYGQWIGAFNWWMPGVYLVAAEGPNQPGLVYKSFDRFGTIGKLRPATGFAAAPANSKGKMLALSGATGATQDPDSLWGIFTVGTPNLYKLDGVTWDLVSSALGTGARCLEVYTGYIFYTQKATVLADYGNLMLSVDDGATFNPVLATCSCITRGPDGTFWACTHSAKSGGYCTDVYIYSSPNGTVWTQRYTYHHANLGAIGNIAVNPENANQIAAYMGSLIAWDVFVSLDGGTVWAKQSAPGSIGPDEDQQGLVWGQNQRLVIGYHTSCRVSVSDDFGVTWVQKHQQGATRYCEDLIRCGMWLCVLSQLSVLGTQEHLARSKDNGDTWENAATDTINSDACGLAYNPAGERLYVHWNNAGVGCDVGRMAKITDPLATFEASWKLLTYNWATVPGATAAGGTRRGIGIKA